jgi:hypothetical protein
MGFKTYNVKVSRRIEEMSPEEFEEYKRSITKMAKTVKAPRDLLMGKEAAEQRFRGKIIYGPNKIHLMKSLVER